MPPESMPLQGNLFKEADEDSATLNSLQKSQNLEDSELNDEALTKDAEQRPRKKKTKTKVNSQTLEKQESNSDENQPSWSHHSLVDKYELTPVLRHYVDLKEQNPGRILLYRLGDFFECFFEDAINSVSYTHLTLPTICSV